MEVMGTYAGDKSPPELEPLLLQRRSGDDGGGGEMVEMEVATTHPWR